MKIFRWLEKYLALGYGGAPFDRHYLKLKEKIKALIIEKPY